MIYRGPQAFLRSYNWAHHLPNAPSLSNCLSLSVFLLVPARVDDEREGDGVGEEPNHNKRE
jgi:hypothetical protein